MKLKYVYVLTIFNWDELYFFSTKEKLIKFVNEQFTNIDKKKSIQPVKNLKDLAQFDGWCKKVRIDNGMIGLIINTRVE